MTFLPIVQRELRVAARRKSTHYVRGAAALLGMVIGFFLLAMTMLTGPGRTGFGTYMFNVLSWYLLMLTLLAGIFLAADCLSEERREGTLGLLFLTDLKGYDVVLGKFMAVSLNAFYGLMAIFPVLAMSQLPGGVGAAEFWRTCLALANILFFSITSGMLISSVCQSSYRAMTGAIALLLTWLAVTRISSMVGLDKIGMISPFEPFLMASDSQYVRLAREYWVSLLVSHVMGWLFLGWTSWRMRTFVDRAKKSNVVGQVLTRDLLGKRAERRARLLDVNPVLWLLDDSRRMRWVAWLLSLAGAGALILTSMSAGVGAVFLGGYIAWPFYFLLKVFVAIQACRFFGEARRTGALELIACTPVKMRDIVRGQAMLLMRVFFWPALVLLGTHLVCLIAATGGNSGFGTAGGGFPFGGFLFLYQFKVIPNNAADFFAISWFGMWLALSMQRPNMAAGLTLLCVVILPMIAVCVPTLLTDAIFIVVGVVKLSEDFRLRQAQWVTLKPAAAST